MFQPRLIRELLLRALRKRRPWRVSGTSMGPRFNDGDLVLVDRGAQVQVGDVVVASHPFKKVDIIKSVERVDPDGYLYLRSPSGDDSRQFGRVTAKSVHGRVTANITSKELIRA